MSKALCRAIGAIDVPDPSHRYPEDKTCQCHCRQDRPRIDGKGGAEAIPQPSCSGAGHQHGDAADRNRFEMGGASPHLTLKVPGSVLNGPATCASKEI